ncbi:RHS repeat-associated core domain-containing protein [Pseudomonas sp. C1C7]|uniref:RHS repeat-associated core domain-containing protein n=1 Tax=Pseudomonas sp. C1C7 TaxID=2735272 RepID=UPI002113D8E9|nr:RHS repeat-associated core domain-containing protein [Pseudomonas sp. C1C7]
MTQPNLQHTVLLATDLKNSILAELDARGPNPIAYSPYGQQSAQHVVMTRLGFNGELREAKPEWYLLGNGYRAYNPQLMRFQSPDSLSPFDKGGRHAYMYCGGEPVMNSDPSGHSVWTFSRLVMQLTDEIATSASLALNKIATTISSGTLEVAQRAKKVFTDNFMFDPQVLERLGPPPPKFRQQPPLNRVITRQNPRTGPNSVRAQQAPFVSKTENGPRITGTTGATKRVTELRRGN